MFADPDLLQQVQFQGVAQACAQGGGPVGTVGEQVQHRLASGIKLQLALGQLQERQVLANPLACVHEVDHRRLQAVEALGLRVVAVHQVQPAGLIEHELGPRLVGAACFHDDPAGDGTVAGREQLGKVGFVGVVGCSGGGNGGRGRWGGDFGSAWGGERGRYRGCFACGGFGRLRSRGLNRGRFGLAVSWYERPGLERGALCR